MNQMPVRSYQRLIVDKIMKIMRLTFECLQDCCHDPAPTSLVKYLMLLLADTVTTMLKLDAFCSEGVYPSVLVMKSFD